GRHPDPVADATSSLPRAPAAASVVEQFASGTTPPACPPAAFESSRCNQCRQRVIAGRHDLCTEFEAGLLSEPLVVVDAGIVGKADHRVREVTVLIGLKGVADTRMPVPDDGRERVLEQHF